SKETSKQQRLQAFAQSFRTYLISAWTAAYPFYAFKWDEISHEPLFVWAGAGLYLVAFLTLVLFPYFVGRTRYQNRLNITLQRVSDECRSVSIATDPGVSESYRRKVMERVFGNLRSVFDDVGKNRPFFKYMTSEAHSLFSEPGSDLFPPPPSYSASERLAT